MERDPSPARALSLEHPEGEPILFYGPPAQLRGTLRLSNGSAEKVKLSTLLLDLPKVQGSARQAGAQVSVAARVYPYQQASVPATLRLDPSTPPGTYEGSVALGDRSQPVRLHVTEKIDLRVEPRRVSIYTEGDRVFERRFVVENAGNVPLELGEKCVVPLGDVTELRAAIHEGLKDACDAKCAEDVLKSLLCAWSRQQTGPMSISREPVTLEPGETRPLTLRFELPSDLHRFRRYVANLPLYTTSLQLEVVTGNVGNTAAR